MNLIYFVQFTHPGGEHGCDRGSTNFKSWNYGKHQRKFLRANGSIMVNGNAVHNQDVIFWGEWEPQSNVVRINNRPLVGDYPHYIHKPALKLSALKTNSKKQIPQNTDPFVFADCFYYCCCKQLRYKTLRGLDKGSIILFGSTLKDANGPYFGVDTVFVVGDYRDYDSSNYKKQLNGFVPNQYDKIAGLGNSLFVQRTAINGCTSGCCSTAKPYKGSLCFRCYAGATPQNSIFGMYSFVPSKQHATSTVGFERLKIRERDFALLPSISSSIINDNLNSTPKITKHTINQNVEIWERLCSLNKQQGLLEGVSFKY